MIQLPKITKIEGGAATLESDAIALDNYKILSFLFENAAGAKLTVKVKASKDGGTAKAVPFVLKDADTEETENIKADGKEIAGKGTFLAVITDRMFAHDEYDSASISLSVDTGTIKSIFALQDKARYTNE